MTVAELIEKLKAMPQDSVVVIPYGEWMEDEEVCNLVPAIIKARMLYWQAQGEIAVVRLTP